MKMYQYHNKTHVFLMEKDVQVDPLETKLKGYTVYVGMPSFCTDIKPPAAQKNKSSVFNDGSWKTVDDYRGIDFYNISTIEKVRLSLGEKPTSELTKLAPFENCKWDKTKWVEDAEKITELKMETIRSKRNYLLDQTDLKCCNAEKWEDLTVDQKLKWKTYKQLLRDLPEKVDVDKPVFPELPKI